MRVINKEYIYIYKYNIGCLFTYTHGINLSLGSFRDNALLPNTISIQPLRVIPFFETSLLCCSRDSLFHVIKSIRKWNKPSRFNHGTRSLLQLIESILLTFYHITYFFHRFRVILFLHQSLSFWLPFVWTLQIEEARKCSSHVRLASHEEYSNTFLAREASRELWSPGPLTFLATAPPEPPEPGALDTHMSAGDPSTPICCDSSVEIRNADLLRLTCVTYVKRNQRTRDRDSLAFKIQ
jgi:hypothetical protein